MVSILSSLIRLAELISMNQKKLQSSHKFLVYSFTSILKSPPIIDESSFLYKANQPNSFRKILDFANEFI